jgi:hypothetical protein
MLLLQASCCCYQCHYPGQHGRDQSINVTPAAVPFSLRGIVPGCRTSPLRRCRDETSLNPLRDAPSSSISSRPWATRRSLHSVCWTAVEYCLAQCVLEGCVIVTLISVCCFAQCVLEGGGMLLRTVCAGRLWNAALHSVCWKVVECCLAQVVECCLAKCVLLKLTGGMLLRTVCAVDVDGWNTAWHQFHA